MMKRSEPQVDALDHCSGLEIPDLKKFRRPPAPLHLQPSGFSLLAFSLLSSA